MRDAIVVNLVREGINNHRARELAEHFYSQLQPAPVQDVSLIDEGKTAAQRQWVGLTTEEIYACDEASGLPQHEITNADLQAFACAIEAKLRSKNI